MRTSVRWNGNPSLVTNLELDRRGSNPAPFPFGAIFSGTQIAQHDRGVFGTHKKVSGNPPASAGGGCRLCESVGAGNGSFRHWRMVMCMQQAMLVKLNLSAMRVNGCDGDL